MRTCIDSITMNRYNLNIPFNSIMLLSTYEPTQSSQNNDSNDSIKSINSIHILFRQPFFGKRSISLTFLGCFESTELIQSYQSLKVNRLSHLLHEHELAQSAIKSLRKWWPGGRVVWGRRSQILRSCRMAGSIPVAARARDPPYHRGFGNCMVQIYV